jgi:hypothetical protein
MAQGKEDLYDIASLPDMCCKTMDRHEADFVPDALDSTYAP